MAQECPTIAYDPEHPEAVGEVLDRRYGKGKYKVTYMGGYIKPGNPLYPKDFTKLLK